MKDETEQMTWREVILQIRNSRAKLGSILDWIDSQEHSPDMLVSLIECADSIRAEVDRMVATIAMLRSDDK